jgi:hypothetical protein
MRTSFGIFCIIIFFASLVYTYWNEIIGLFEDEVIVLLPEPEPEPEPFRLVFTSLIKEPCRYKIDGWINNTPYIIDFKNKESIGKYARNRIEVGVPYVEVNKFTPRKPSLRKAQPGEDPILLVKSFKVEDQKNKIKGGTEKVGVAEIIDFPVSKKPYIISSQTETTVTPYHILQFETPRARDSESIRIFSRDLNKTVTVGNMNYNFSDPDFEKRTISVSRTNNKNGFIIVKTLKAPETINFSRSIKKLPTRQTVNAPIISKIVKPTVRHPVPSRPLKDHNTYYGRGTSEKEAYYEARKQIKRSETQHSYRFRKTGLTWTCTLYATTGK